MKHRLVEQAKADRDIKIDAVAAAIDSIDRSLDLVCHPVGRFRPHTEELFPKLKPSVQDIKLELKTGFALVRVGEPSYI